jgi:hypothetical protein
VNEIVTALNVIAASVAQRLGDSPFDPSVSHDGLKCVQMGGLFKPSAVAAFADRVVVLDGAAPAIYNFYNDGKHHTSERLPFLPDAAAISSDGSVLLSREEKVYSWLDAELKQVRQFDHMVTALCFSSNGRAYAAVSDNAALHEVLSGKCLFKTKIRTDAIAATEDELFILDSENVQVEVRGRLNREVVGRYPCGGGLGKLETIAADGRRIWVTGRDTWRVEEIDRETCSVRRLVVPERSVTAMAISNGSLVLAGSNLHGSLSDRVGHSSGSLYLLQIQPDK